MQTIVEIPNWNGGLFGNNIMQLAAAIFFAKCCNGNTTVNIANNPFFRVNHTLSFSKQFDIEINDVSEVYWNDHSQYNPINELVNIEEYKIQLQKNMKSVYENDIYTILNETFNFDAYDYDLSNTLVIHLRSGDIFSLVAPNYIQCPWSYFEKILSKFNYNKVIICTGFGGSREDLMNPCYYKIIEFCNNHNIEVDYRLRSLSEDVYLLSHAEKIVIGGVSTFVLSCAHVNRNCKEIHYPSFFDIDVPGYVPLFSLFDTSITKLNLYKFYDYYEDNSWIYDEKFMLEYPQDKIVEIV